ncbi:hypothetical protein PABG_11895 [Paracoccidioides brasiliensis Pb03]|uniref:Uncharacterized protein n=1 Tax=Paracoccidioides brasiliensis (strain Pb18) TaxID=502780 RepID=C1GBZ7_PARBD|nr:uncharacterized protein PADG_04519 [Paracoccidioides brasiliensis Pb18]EEH48440.1 hypothetical protein PADG_04519 [Paracoccidioides brasiliensis Pb18]KGY15117.1 hypothetical protein PABG_11895 [Paracoccidioides brasiliensis Pb03]
MFRNHGRFSLEEFDYNETTDHDNTICYPCLPRMVDRATAQAANRCAKVEIAGITGGKGHYGYSLNMV